MNFVDPVEGFDISGHQPIIDWAQVGTTGKEFCIIKSTEHTSYVNECMESQIAGAISQNLFRGFYHYFRGMYNGQDQAEHYLKYTPEIYQLPDTFDFEDPGAMRSISAEKYVARAVEFLDFIKPRRKFQPWVYTAAWCLDGISNELRQRLAEYNLWLAAWPYSRSYKTDYLIDIPKPWSSFEIWQYTNGGRISGIKNYLGKNTSVDLNVMERSVLNKYLGATTEPTPEYSVSEKLDQAISLLQEVKDHV